MNTATTLLLALGISVLFTGLLWGLGVIRAMVGVQEARQKRMGDQPNLRRAEWGTGAHAAISFALAIWLVTFGVVFFGLLVWA